MQLSRRQILGGVSVAALMVANGNVAKAQGFRGKARRGTYPTPVVTASKQSVWDLYVTAGSRVSKGSMTAIASLGANGNIAKTAQNVNFGPNTASVSSVDFTGNQVGFYGNTNASVITDCYFSNNTGNHLSGVGSTTFGTNVSTPSIDFEYCTFDYSNMMSGAPQTGQAFFAGSDAFDIGDGCHTTFNGCLFKESSRDFLGHFGNPTTTFTSCAFFAFGVNTDLLDHLEGTHCYGGTITYTNCLFDPNHGSPRRGGLTGTLFFEGTNSVINATLDGCIIAGTTIGNMLYPIQTKANNNDVNLTIQNCLIDPGSSGIVGPTSQGNITLTSVTGTFTANETIHNGSGVTAQVQSYNSGTGVIVLVAGSYTVKFTVGDTITGNTSGAHGTISARAQNLCTITNGGNNHNLNTGALLSF